MLSGSMGDSEDVYVGVCCTQFGPVHGIGTVRWVCRGCGGGGGVTQFILGHGILCEVGEVERGFGERMGSMVFVNVAPCLFQDMASCWGGGGGCWGGCC